MAVKKKNNILTRKEQCTTTAFKMMSEKINTLEASLKKTQDECEKYRAQKNEIEKEKVLLESKLSNHLFIKLLEFMAAGAFGFALSYLSENNYQLVLSIGLPALIIYAVCIYLTKK